MEFEAVKKFVIEKMKNELDSQLFYHSKDHTLDVIEAAERLAQMEGLSENKIQLLKTAALFHDFGFINTYNGHEEESIKLAYSILPQFDFKEKEIQQIATMIKATEMPQKPASLMEQIIADADLDYLGRDDLFLIGQKLHQEWRVRGLINSLKEWHVQQLEFLKKHQYFTASAKKLRDKKKLENIHELESLLCPKN